ncbi:fibronectin type III domain-containing protein, partial [Paenibacillus arenilitoris]|nr:hypothetical protein [Paenibacillus arenilitoris]
GTLNLTLRSTGDNGGGTVYVDGVTLYYGEEDFEAPTAPKGFRTIKNTSSKIQFNWDMSTDNNEVLGYEIYLNDNFLGTTTNSSYTANNLLARSWYKFSIRAFDDAGNYSELVDFKAATFGANLVSNGGFEEYSQLNGVGSYWSSSVRNGAVADLKLVHAPVINGQTAQKVQGYGIPNADRIKVSQEVEVQPNLPFTFKSNVYVESIANSKFVYYIDFADENGDWIDGIALERTTGTGGYVLLTASGIVPEEARSATINIALRATGNGGAGTIYIDAVEFSYINKATYRYNEKNQLESISYSDGTRILYTYDSNGNLIQIRREET